MPDTDKNRLIKLDTTLLSPSNYATLPWFTPGSKENPARRPPKIYNIEEAVAKYAVVPIDTYLFNRDFTEIKVLVDGNKEVSTNGASGPNPFAGMRGMQMPGRPGAGMPSGRNPMNVPNVAGSMPGVSGTDTPVYTVRSIPFAKWNSQYLTAHQLQPLRMAIVAGSFPYKRQLEEHKKELRLGNLEAVRNELAADDSGEKSFRFLEVLIERVEVDANDKAVGPWKRLDLRKDYGSWLQLTYFPFQAENPKYDLVKFDGLVPPLLREFHAKDVNPTMKTTGMFNPAAGPGNAPQAEPPPDEPKSAYPDVPALLPKLQETLDKLGKVEVTQIAAPKTNEKSTNIDLFRPNAAPPAENPQPATPNPATQPGSGDNLTYPEYCLVRFCDVTLQPGKAYRYRVKIVMANPNYKHDDVASPAYKTEKMLTSKEWFEIKETVRAAPELYYYVVDEKQGIGKRELKKDPKVPQPPSAASKLWETDPSPDQVVFQLHRWIEQIPLGSRSDSEVLPVGDWAIADRVIVGRGESVGRKVKVDLPIWMFAKNKFELPHDQQPPPGRPARGNNKPKITTGIPVEFNSPLAKGETILVDFEGGKSMYGKTPDTSRIDVLMLDGDGKLLARNSASDKNDKEREERRTAQFKRIEEIRQGKGNE
jgi:hypothetical protein